VSLIVVLFKVIGNCLPFWSAASMLDKTLIAVFKSNPPPIDTKFKLNGVAVPDIEDFKFLSKAVTL